MKVLINNQLLRFGGFWVWEWLFTVWLWVGWNKPKLVSCHCDCDLKNCSLKVFEKINFPQTTESNPRNGKEKKGSYLSSLSGLYWLFIADGIVIFINQMIIKWSSIQFCCYSKRLPKTPTINELGIRLFFSSLCPTKASFVCGFPKTFDYSMSDVLGISDTK